MRNVGLASTGNFDLECALSPLAVRAREELFVIHPDTRGACVIYPIRVAHAAVSVRSDDGEPVTAGREL